MEYVLAFVCLFFGFILQIGCQGKLFSTTCFYVNKANVCMNVCMNPGIHPDTFTAHLDFVLSLWEINFMSKLLASGRVACA